MYKLIVSGRRLEEIRKLLMEEEGEEEEEEEEARQRILFNQCQCPDRRENSAMTV
jgi:hypothetical protein